MRGSRFLSVSALCAAILAGCGGPADTEAGLAAGATSGGVEAKSWSSNRTASVSSASAPSAASAATAVPVGRLLASNCFNCHGTDGHPSGGFDSLAGDSASEIVKTLQEMAAKSPEDGGIMRAHATGYTDEQMWQLGSYFASQR